MSNRVKYPNNYFEPVEFRGEWQTQCQDCEWVSDFIAPYPDECDVYECPDCESENVVDVNLESEQ